MRIAMKVIWKGSIAFGLVNIPIELYAATESHALGFTLLHNKCNTPLKYHRWCPHCKKEVQWDETVKGLERENGKYLILTQEMLHQLRPKKTEAINIIEFVPIDTINMIYFNNHYYVAPTKQTAAYALFIKALENLRKVAIGRFVMRDKQYTCILQPYESYLLLTTLHYAYEVRGVDKLAFKKPGKLDAAELKLAETFINKLSVKSFNMSKFKDSFAQEIKTLLTKKPGKELSKKKTVTTAKRKKSSLAESLQESLRNVGKRSTVRQQPVAVAKKRR